jgi:hypothetical protein
MKESFLHLYLEPDFLTMVDQLSMVVNQTVVKAQTGGEMNAMDEGIKIFIRKLKNQNIHLKGTKHRVSNTIQSS